MSILKDLPFSTRRYESVELEEPLGLQHEYSDICSPLLIYQWHQQGIEPSDLVLGRPVGCSTTVRSRRRQRLGIDKFKLRANLAASLAFGSD